MPAHALCEPVEMAPGVEASAVAVSLGPKAGEAGRFLHFHDVAEIVLFERVRGVFVADQARLDLRDGDVVFVPSMGVHDFELAAGAKAWTLAYVDPFVVETLADETWRHAARFRPTPDVFARLRMLTDWLAEDETADPATRRALADLMLRALADQPRQDAVERLAAPADPAAGIERLRPAIERLRRDPALPPSLREAAAACLLSPAYFSRRFKAATGMGFSDYARVHRLHLAARRLLEGGEGVAEIAWAAGFSTPSHFTQCFRERFGLTPAAYRREGRRRAA